MQSQKVLLFTNIMAPYRVGLYNQLSKEFEDNIKICFDSENESNRKWELEYDGIRFKYEIKQSLKIQLNSKIANNTKLLRIIYFPFYIFRECIKEKPEIIISSEMGLRTIFSIIIGRILKSKVYILSEVTADSEGSISMIKLIIRKIIGRCVNGGIAHGLESAKYLKMLGVDDSQITISPDSIDNEYYCRQKMKLNKNELRNKYNFNTSDFIFLYVGQFNHRKGLDLLINAFLKVTSGVSENIILLLVGGKYEELEEVIDIKKEDFSRVIIYGFKQMDELIEFYSLADCFVFPTRNDVWGLVVNEAIACELPVVVSKFAGCSYDLIDNNVNGYVVNPLDQAAFSNTLIDCIKKKEDLKKFAKKAKEKLRVNNYIVAAKRIAEICSK